MPDLSSLLVDETKILSDSISLGLQGLVHIGQGTGTVILTQGFSELDRSSRIIAFLLSLRAAVILGVGKKVEATTDEIAAAVGLDVKSTGEYASRLKREFLARGNSGYMIPIEKLPKAASHLQEVRKGKQHL